jgi:hypothetical protein
VLTYQHLIDKIPSHDASKTYADLFLICPPQFRGKFNENELNGKVQHRTRVLHSSTEQGVIYISRHIKPNVLLVGEEHSWALEQIKGHL